MPQRIGHHFDLVFAASAYGTCVYLDQTHDIGIHGFDKGGDLVDVVAAVLEIARTGHRQMKSWPGTSTIANIVGGFSALVVRSLLT